MGRKNFNAFLKNQRAQQKKKKKEDKQKKNGNVPPVLWMI